MKISHARNIDRIVGVPLCLFLTLVVSVRGIFRRSGLKAPRKVVFLGLTEIGAGIMAYPSMRKIQSIWKDAEIYLWVFKDNADFFYATRWVAADRIIVMRSDTFLHLAVDAFRNLRQLRRARVDTVIDLEFCTRFSSLLASLSGATTRVGFSSGATKRLYRGRLYTHRVCYDASLHVSRNFLKLADELIAKECSEQAARLGGDTEELSLPKIKTQSDEDLGVRQKLVALGGTLAPRHQLVIVHIGFHDRLAVRRWPPRHYRDLIRRLLEHPEMIVVLAGIGPKRFFPIDESGNRVINMVGETNSRELFSLLNMAEALVSHDCGIVHIGALTDIAIVALFGPETPGVYGPLCERKSIVYKNFACSPCLSADNYKQSPCRDNRCMKTITVDEVYARLMKVLS